MSFIFIQENAYENIVWNMAAILSRPQYVNILVYHCLPIDHTKARVLSTNNFYNVSWEMQLINISRKKVNNCLFLDQTDQRELQNCAPRYST